MEQWLPLIIEIVVMIIGIGVAWGFLQAKVTNVENAINTKLDRAVFDLHRETDNTRINGIHDWLKRIDEKLDRLIESK